MQTREPQKWLPKQAVVHVANLGQCIYAQKKKTAIAHKPVEERECEVAHGTLDLAKIFVFLHLFLKVAV